MSDTKLIPTNEEEEMRLIQNRFGSDLNKAELAHFLMTAKQTGLNPLRNQIYAIKRGGKMGIQVGIDGFRAIAARSGLHVGTDTEAIYEHEKLIAVKCTVLKFMHGQDRKFVATATMKEYNANGPMWKKMPLAMLSKCAEAKALRQAFPEDLSGLYGEEEMHQADNRAVFETDRTKMLNEALEEEESYEPPEYIEIEEDEDVTK